MTTGIPEDGATPEDRRKLKPSITTALVLGFGTLIVGGMVLVLTISLWSAQKNTRELLAGNAQLAMLSLVRETRRRLEPVQDANNYIAGLLSTGELDPKDRDALTNQLLYSMAGVEQVIGMAFVYPDASNIRVSREQGVIPVVTAGDAAQFRELLADTRTHRGTFWGPPVWVEALKSSVMNVRTPIWQGNDFGGVLVTVVTVDELSRFIARSSSAPLTANRFILYGKDYVLAHKSMADGGYNKNDALPLPKLDEVGSEEIARIWDTENRGRLLIPLGDSTRGHSTDFDGDTHIYLYRELKGFGDVPLTVGIYAGPDDGLGVEFDRLMWAAIVGIGVIVICVSGAVVLGRRLSAPIKALAAGSAAVADLDLEHVSRLKPSRLRELDEAAAAFNRMTTGLQWFETYVPHQLVRRLMSLDAPIASEEKLVTVMFTDIAHFSTLSEHMQAADTANLLNEHFSILAGCIEAEDGTVDKYIGDSVMAFWEPEDGEPNVDRALRAAQKIREGIAADNIERRRAGLPEVQVRVGIHSGLAIVGNIGAPGRINYTLVGDTVNVAARLEQLCKSVGNGPETVILVSGETESLAADTSNLTSAGRHEVRGRDRDIEVFLLST